MRNVQLLLQDPSVSKWIKWVLVLLVARVKKPLFWSSFLALNPLIRRVLQSSESQRDETIGRRLSKLSNIVTCAFLYLATHSNNGFPKDYVLIYLWMSYYGELDKPSDLRVLVSPQTSRYFKVETYSPSVALLYQHKEYVIYPLIFGQLLSNYLTPTKYKFNQRYLSSSIKSQILSPIWITYSLGVRSHSIAWGRLFRSYAYHNLVIGAFVGLMAFKSRALDQYYELKYGIVSGKSVADIVKQYGLYIFHKANSYTNFIYLPNIVSMLLISISASTLSSMNLWNNKNFFKLYIKTIGFIAGFVTLYVNAQEFVPDFGYLRDKSEKNNIRTVSKTFLDGLNLYLFRLILLSKWRITKENHPSFRKLKLSSWYKIETILMCFGVYKIMTLNDFLKRHGGNTELESLPLIKGIEMIM
ncbi:uncharacterized protein CANTADRAFT_51121 [Suhomyces tanzawaensis NRRL Y-17324]|uniref:Uncharacterized protein n=1 Tax=Suhomyces tanzawaensis NRRL Y-17324 TaxID=984487 RepID=A0A1E4SHT1_9ASCO|nr:uncharacterized protein CANTADRAFT_51121 [Suhomyces tanzawaensis NRRL Y-17324]ODV78982.1 hypothetical protein CANTADRAFT_51121 [Suhomyces tanzawaensis NRRL Y-17324]